MRRLPRASGRFRINKSGRFTYFQSSSDVPLNSSLRNARAISCYVDCNNQAALFQNKLTLICKRARMHENKHEAKKKMFKVVARVALKQQQLLLKEAVSFRLVSER